MKGVHGSTAGDHPNYYVAQTRVHEHRLEDYKTSPDAITLDRYVAESAENGVGTDEFRAWLDRAAWRRGRS